MHRDLKPENVLIDTMTAKKITVKLIDFGTAQSFFSKGEYQQTLGTPYYIAPEVLMNNYNERCDIWSCGVILFIMLCGKPPFNGVSNEDIMRTVKKVQYNFDRIYIMPHIGPEWKTISEGAKDLIKNMIKYPPTLRFTAEQAYAHPWIQERRFKGPNADSSRSLLAGMKDYFVTVFYSPR